jgi:hypothetical protein
MLIDVAIPGDRNVIQKEAEKSLKYEDLTIEIQRTWSVKTRVIPVIIEATGTISKSFRMYVSTIPGNQKTDILGSSICPLSSTESVEPPPPLKIFLGMPLLVANRLLERWFRMKSVRVL